MQYKNIQCPFGCCKNIPTLHSSSAFGWGEKNELMNPIISQLMSIAQICKGKFPIIVFFRNFTLCLHGFTF